MKAKILYTIIKNELNIKCYNHITLSINSSNNKLHITAILYKRGKCVLIIKNNNKIECEYFDKRDNAFYKYCSLIKEYNVDNNKLTLILDDNEIIFINLKYNCYETNKKI